MRPSGAKAALVDTGFIFALFDPRDSYHLDAVELSDLFDAVPLALPWPCLYEAVNTRFVRNRARVARLESLLKRANVELIDDSPYRDGAYELTIRSARLGRRHIALADMVARLMLDDINLNLGYLFTFNPGDFSDVCRTRRIEMVEVQQGH